MTTTTVDEDFEELWLTVPNEADYVALARFAAGVLAARASFNLEELQDLQLAVDELYTSSGASGSGASARIDLQRTGFEVRITLTIQQSPMGSSPPEGSLPSGGVELSRQLLSALVDEHGSSADEQGAPCVWLRKRHVPQ